MSADDGSFWRPVDVRMWEGDDKFPRLSRPQPNAQTLFLWLLAGPLTTPLPGLIAAGVYTIAERLRWPVDATAAAVGELSDAGMIRVDDEARVILLPNALRYRQPSNPNIVRGWGRWFSLVPDCGLKAELWLRLRDHCLKRDGAPRKEPARDTFTAAFCDAFPPPAGQKAPTPPAAVPPPDKPKKNGGGRRRRRAADAAASAAAVRMLAAAAGERGACLESVCEANGFTFPPRHGDVDAILAAIHDGSRLRSTGRQSQPADVRSILADVLLKGDEVD